MQVVYCIYPGNSQPLDRKDETVTNASEIKMLNTMFLQPLIFLMSGPHTCTTLQCPRLDRSLQFVLCVIL